MILSAPVLAVFFVGAFVLIVGGIILAQSPRNPINVSFALFAGTGALWAISLAFFLSLNNSYWLDVLARLLYVGGVSIPVAFYYFSLAFRDGRFRSPLATCLIFLPLAFLAALYFWTDLTIRTYAIDPAGVRGFSYGPLHLLFDSTLWVYFSLALYSFYTRYRTAGHQERPQVLLILVGTYSTLAVAAATNIVTPSFFGVFQYIWIGPFAMIVWVSSVAYAVARFQLFNVRVIAAELLVVSLWVFLVVRMLLSQNNYDFLINAVSFTILLVLGLFLIRSVIKEVSQRELIEAQEKELEVANRQQEGLLHFISHEIKGYLTKNEAAFAAIASGDFGQTSDSLKHMSESALEDTRKGVDTVMDILDAANLKKGTVSFAKTTFDLSKDVEQVVADMQTTAKQKGLDLSLKTATGAILVEGDEDKIRRHVIRNVLDNSVKYTPSGSIKVTLMKDGRAVRLLVSDTGVGITSEDMRHLFTEGGHGAESIKVNVHSTGYGLFIAKQVVEAHGGKIWAESEGKGKGAKFTVEFPLSA